MAPDHTIRRHKSPHPYPRSNKFPRVTSSDEKSAKDRNENSTIGTQQTAVFRQSQDARGGYSCNTELYTVRESVIHLNTSDGDRYNEPPIETQKLTEYEDGTFSQFVPVEPGDKRYKEWMEYIGKMLAKWVINPDLKRGTLRLANGSTNRVDIARVFAYGPKFTLGEFPHGYSLWLHRTGRMDDQANARVDPYLYGAEHLGPTTAHATPSLFRSPQEFVRHAIWLMQGGVGRCVCCYCKRGQAQLRITYVLEYATPEKPDLPDDFVPPATPSSSFGLSGSRGAVRGPRRGKKEEKKIMVKDYRVGLPQAASNWSNSGNRIVLG